MSSVRRKPSFGNSTIVARTAGVRIYAQGEQEDPEVIIPVPYAEEPLRVPLKHLFTYS